MRAIATGADDIEEVIARISDLDLAGELAHYHRGSRNGWRHDGLPWEQM